MSFKNIFLNKKLSYVLLLLAIIVVVLGCILLTNLSQIQSLNAQCDRLEQLIEDVNKGIVDKQEALDYIKSNEYIFEWAKENGRITEDDIAWIPNN